MIAIIIASIGFLVAFISLTATGTMAVRMRMVSPRTDLLLGDAELIPASLPTRGRNVPDVLGPLIDVTVETALDQATMRDTFLCEDGCILLVTASCAACRYLVHQSRDLLINGTVRTLVAAPTTERGKEFIEKDCKGAGIAYQVDTAGERGHALGITEFPSVLVIADGIISAAYIVGNPGHLRVVSAPPGNRKSELPPMPSGDSYAEKSAFGPAYQKESH